jgi:hypothetical protein
VRFTACPICERPTIGNPAMCGKCAYAMRQHTKKNGDRYPDLFDAMAWAARRARMVERRRQARDSKG